MKTIFYTRCSNSGQQFIKDIGKIFSLHYQKQISDNVKRALENKVHKGEYPSSAPYGYKRVGKDIVIDNKKARVVRYIYKLKRNGKTTYEIKTKVMKNRKEDLSKSMIRKILNNPFYRGIMRWNGNNYSHIYDRII